ncbi:hypothetical protein B0H12DRAFT_1145216 [Mycena haematopus]|nr:hypothetical protein B0H12DRAFT_1145216 [Mycena haematopus]
MSTFTWTAMIGLARRGGLRTRSYVFSRLMGVHCLATASSVLYDPLRTTQSLSSRALQRFSWCPGWGFESYCTFAWNLKSF